MNRLRRAAAARLRAWAARRHGADTLPLGIQVRRIYILPTRAGMLLAVMVVAMLLAGLNYNSNLGLAFGFLVASIAMTAMHHCHRNLLGLTVDLEQQADGFAGGSAQLGVLLQNDSGVARYDIEIHCAPDAGTVTAIGAGSACKASLTLPTPARGLRTLQPCELATRWPLGWFRAWTYVQAPIRVYIAPRPLGGARAETASAAQGEYPLPSRRGEDEFAGLTPYTPGVPLKHFAWKTLARGRPAAVRSYLDAAGSPLWLDFDSLAPLEPEARLSQLCRWVLDAQAAARPYGLRLPGVEIPPDHGAAQQRACLRALAAFAGAPPA